MKSVFREKWLVGASAAPGLLPVGGSSAPVWPPMPALEVDSLCEFDRFFRARGEPFAGQTLGPYYVETRAGTQNFSVEACHSQVTSMGLQSW